MDKKLWRMLGSRKALTQMQAVAIVVIIVVGAIIGSVYYYTTLPTPTPFSMQVIPEHIEDSIPGQRCVFLVVVADESGKGKAVEVSATTSSGSVTVYPQAITPEQVAEVTVVPDKASIGENLTVTVRGERDGLEQTETVTVKVWEGDEVPDLIPLAVEIRDKFIPWLASNHPEFEITKETEWTGTIVLPHIVVVMYYLFFSEDWEMGLSWHVTIPPHNWARIYIRHRFTEVSPSYAFEISTWSEEEYEIYDIDPKDAFAESVWR